MGVCAICSREVMLATRAELRRAAAQSTCTNDVHVRLT